MYSAAVTKPQVLRSLDTVLFVHGQAVDSCCLEEGSSDVPQAFHVVSKHLPIAGDIFGSVKSQLKATNEETEQTKEMYLVIKQVADDGCAQLRALEILFDTMTQEGKKMECYASAVKGCDGKKLGDAQTNVSLGSSIRACNDESVGLPIRIPISIFSLFKSTI